MDTPFVLEQKYQVPLEQVWRALTTEGQMRVWYFPQLQQFEPVVGFDFAFIDDGSLYQKQWQVTQVEEGKRLAHSWAYSGYPGNSEVVFDLMEEGDTTKLVLTHTGLDSFPLDSHFARQRFERGWQQILGSNLKQYLETH
jgi:uncharacterized protein YndB with AHSA1/START domain